MIKLYVPEEIDAELIKIARELARARKDDVTIETRDQYIEIRFKKE